MKRRKLLQHLAMHGCRVLREGRKHTTVINAVNGRRSQVPRHSEIKPTTAKSICRDLAVPIPEEK